MRERKGLPEHNALGIARRAYRRALEPVCRQWGLTHTELDVLLFFYNNPQYDRSADVVERRGLQKSHVSLSVGNLIHRGMLERQPDPADKRSARLTVTHKGSEAAQEGKRIQKWFTQRLTEGISEKELEDLGNTMKKILRNMENIDETEPKKE